MRQQEAVPIVKMRKLPLMRQPFFDFRIVMSGFFISLFPEIPWSQ